MKYLFIVNPTAGRGACSKKWQIIEEEIKKNNLEYQVVFTKCSGDGVFLAKEGVQKEFDVIVAVGGDGTINEIIKGIIEEGANEKVTLGIVAAGTGNDLVRSLDIPRDIVGAVKVLKNGLVKKIDMGKVNGDYFVNVVGIGFDAAVAYEINHNVKWLKGTAAYLFGVVKTLFKYKSPEMKIRIDDIYLEDQYFLVAIANGKYYGGGMMIGPGAEIDDEKFDVIVVKNVKKLEVLRFLPKIFKGKHITHPAVSVYRGKKVFLQSDEQVLIQADGELKGILPMGFEVQSQKLSVLIP